MAGAGDVYTPWEALPAGDRSIVLEGLHGAVVTPGVNVARHRGSARRRSCPSSTSSGSRSCRRDQTLARYSTEAVTDTILAADERLRPLHLPAVFAHHVNFQRYLSSTRRILFRALHSDTR